MFLCIDSGNTRTKAAVYDAGGNVLGSIVTQEQSIGPIRNLLIQHPAHHVIKATTGSTNWELAALDIKGKKIELTHETPLPIELLYATPETLGRDRIAGACGARAMFPEKTCLIISAGTCMTMDILLHTGIYLGGNIAPGLSMRLQSMHDYTARLPLVEEGWPTLVFGDSTIHAMQNGACLGMIMEIEGIFQRAKNAFGEVFIVMTGGNAAFLADKAESQIFVAPELVTQGLFQILNFNV